MSKKIYSASADRELKSLHKNHLQEKRLSESTKKEEVNLRRETKLTDHQKHELAQDRKVIMSKTPSMSEWKKQHETTYESWKEREREKIDKRYRSPARHCSNSSVGQIRGRGSFDDN